MPNKFIISCTNDKIWNYLELVKFLSSSQGKDIILYVNPEAIDLSLLGVYDLVDCFNFQSVEIVTCNPFEHSTKYRITIVDNQFLKEYIVNVDDLHKWNNKKVFLTCYGRPTANRLGIAAYLNSHYTDLSLIHFSGGSAVDNINLYEINKLAEFRLDSINDVASLIPKMPLLFNQDTNYDFRHYEFSDPLTKCYENIFVDLVSESHVLGNTFFPTEKTTRPMWLKKPFITFASKNYLLYLRQLGFRTFGDFWSEDYDAYEARDRFIKILELIDTLAKKSKNELEKMYWDMQYTLDHNYNLLLSQNYNTNITYIA